jgi:hypothetical protein
MGNVHLYLDFPLGIGVGGDFGTTLAILPGVEADILLPIGIPLYVYPMFGIGFGFFFPKVQGIDTQKGFGLRFGGGIKYILDGKWNFFFEPFNLEIYPSLVDIGGISQTPGFYNLMFGGGGNF